MIKRLIDTFSCYTKLPIDIQDIIDHIRENGAPTLNIFPVDIDDRVVRGFVDRYTIRSPYDLDGTDFTDIYFSARMPQHWQRLVCCKEIVHVFDGGNANAQTRQQVSQLITEVVRPTDLMSMSHPGQVDHVAILWALALLFPMDAREFLKEPYAVRRLNTMDIAKMAQIPHRYIEYLMSDQYETDYRVFILGEKP